MVGGGRLIVIGNAACALVPCASATRTVTEDVPDEIGTPAITPVCVSILNPGGRPVADQEYAPLPPVAVTRALYGVPLVPDGRLVLTIARLLFTVNVAVLDFAPPGLMTATPTGPGIVTA